ncbi:MAG: HD domain-containing protein, partial [Geminicoccaceae bacterium]
MYKETELWKRAQRQAETADSLEAWTRLESEYEKLWTRANRIAEKISSELPGLTLHNQAHLEAVWDVADQLAGPKFPIIPLETFVFGGAVLLHDLAHSVTAYRGGISEVRKTPEWRQAVLWRLDLDDDAPDPSDQEIAHPSDEIARAALFDTLRTLHAEQAEKLYNIPYALPDGEIYLIDDITLRRHLGLTIGKIAASHHWDREKLRPQLRKQIGPLGWAPKLGSIQPVKLACLLRCADACQIDQRRAPDFDLAVQAPIGMSAKHWQAQNRLTVPTIEGESLAFTATQAFDQGEADVWWIAHDLIQIAHQELQECAALMRDQDLLTFCVTGVAGASDPAKLAEDYVETEGWTPVDASLRVSNPRRMVEMFGGEQYYGEDALWVPLRELLQNGIDAIEARRLLEPENSGYEGRILVEQVAGELDGKDGYWLHVSDDGIGMSKRVLTRTLVDFGHSAKTSGELTEEFQGLRGKRVPTIGQYGIGFFSVLMLSDHVLVQSRPFDQGHDSTKKLRFAWGAESRPLLLDGEPSELRGMSTKVSLFIENATFDRFAACLGHYDIVDGKDVDNESLIKLVQMVAPLPNCQLDVCEPDSDCQLVRSPTMYKSEQALDWL